MKDEHFESSMLQGAHAREAHARIANTIERNLRDNRQIYDEFRKGLLPDYLGKNDDKAERVCRWAKGVAEETHEKISRQGLH